MILFADATYRKIRVNGVVLSTAIFIVTRVLENGRRSILAVDSDQSEKRCPLAQGAHGPQCPRYARRQTCRQRQPRWVQGRTGGDADGCSVATLPDAPPAERADLWDESCAQE